MFSKLTPAAVALAALAAPTPARADIIVQRVPGASASAVRSDAGVKLVDRLPVARTEVVKAAPGDQADALEALNGDPNVVYAEADRKVHAFTTDHFWTSQWDLSNLGDPGADISATQAWDLSQGAGVTVGVVDTGAEFSHVDLAGQFAVNPGESGDGRESNGIDDDHDGLVDDYRGWDWVAGDNDPSDANGHGTHVSGTIAAVSDNGIGVAGVAPQARVMPLRVLDAYGSGWDSDIAAAFDYAGKLGLRVVNASLGGVGYSQVMRDAIAAHPNTLYVVAAGNDGADDDDPSTAEYPCAYDLANVVCVGATDEHDLPADFSNHGAASVDLFAPGVNIISTWGSSPTSYAWLDGTSMATPHVAGAAALVLSADPGISAPQIKQALLDNVDRRSALTGLSVTGGRLNAAAAVAAIEGVAAEPAPAPARTATPTPTPPPASPAPVSPPPAPAAPPSAPSAPVQPVTSQPVTSQPVTSQPAAPQPVLRHLHLRGSLSRRHGRLRVTFTLSRSASVRFTVRRHGSRRSSGTWTVRARGGANAYTLTRRLPTHRTLPAGTYTLRVTLAASASTARFKIHR